MRNNRELAQLMISILSKSKYDLGIEKFVNENPYIHFTGLCILIYNLCRREIISIDEMISIDDFLKANRPIGKDQGEYWFTEASVNPERAKKERIEFLKHLIDSYEGHFNKIKTVGNKRLSSGH